MSRTECRMCGKSVPSETLNCPHCGGRREDYKEISVFIRSGYYIAFVLLVSYLTFLWWFTR